MSETTNKGNEFEAKPQNEQQWNKTLTNMSTTHGLKRKEK